ELVVDLGARCGTIAPMSSMARWLAALFVSLFVLSSTSPASAQAFKPKAKSAKSAKKAPAKKAAPKKGGAKKGKKSRVSETAGRPEDLTPEQDAKKKKPEDDDDYVLIEDDEE
ncbi:MAG: hypothetical protein ACKV2T_01515, partial [Kofleriaceae bacterium]